MSIYETLNILHPELSAARVKEVVAGMQKTLEESQAKMLQVEEWGLRNLAYDIQKQKRGYYVRFEYDSPPQAVRDLERVLRLSEDAMRFLSVARAAPSEGQDPRSQSSKPDKPEESEAQAAVSESTSEPAEAVAAEPAEAVVPAEAEAVATEPAAPAEAEAVATKPAAPAEAEVVASEPAEAAELKAVAPGSGANDAPDRAEGHRDQGWCHLLHPDHLRCSQAPLCAPHSLSLL